MSTITQGFLDHKIFSIVSDVAARLGVRAFVIGGSRRLQSTLARLSIAVSTLR